MGMHLAGIRTEAISQSWNLVLFSSGWTNSVSARIFSNSVHVDGQHSKINNKNCFFLRVLCKELKNYNIWPETAVGLQLWFGTYLYRTGELADPARIFQSYHSLTAVKYRSNALNCMAQDFILHMHC